VWVGRAIRCSAVMMSHAGGPVMLRAGGAGMLGPSRTLLVAGGVVAVALA